MIVAGRPGAIASHGVGWALAGLGALVGLALVVGTSIGGLASHATLEAMSATAGDPYIRRVAAFTVFQAGLSALLSIALALPVARAASRRGDHWMVRGFLRLASLAFVTPVIIGVFGVVQIHGRSGWIGDMADVLGIEIGGYLYGLSGILIAHLFFNVPFAARNMKRALDVVAPETWRLAAQLGMSPAATFRLVEWPAIRTVLFPTGAVIFALCFTSFAVVLTLGGGPRATILEVAIYQALRFDFAIDRAVGLALVQIVLAGALAGLIAAFARPVASEPGEGMAIARLDRDLPGARLTDGLAFLLAAAIFILPLAGIVVPAVAALTTDRLVDPALWRAAAWSLTIALAAGGFSLVLGIGLMIAIRELGERRGQGAAAGLLEGAGAIILVTPPVLLGAGLFLALSGRVDVFAAAPVLVIAVNGVATLPFVMRLLGPDFRRTATMHDRLCASLGVNGLDRWRLIDWPTIRPAAGTALAVATAMAAGDLGVIALFGTPDTTTLPLLIYQRMGAYRMADAAVAVAVLMVMTLILITVVERFVGGRRGA